MSYSMMAFKAAFGPAPNAQALTASIRQLINRIPRAAQGDNHTIQHFVTMAHEATQAIKAGDLHQAVDRIADLRNVLEGFEEAAEQAAEQAAIEGRRPRPLPPLPAPVPPRVVSAAVPSASAGQATPAAPVTPAAPAAVRVAATNAQVSPSPKAANNSRTIFNSQNLMFDDTAKKTTANVKINADFPLAAAAPVTPAAPQAIQAAPAAQPAAPAAPAAVAPQAVQAAQPAVSAALLKDKNRQAANDKILFLRGVLNWGVKLQPYLSDPIQYNQLVNAVEKIAADLEKRVLAADNLSEAERTKEYQRLTAVAHAEGDKYKRQILAAQTKVATQHKAFYDALETEEQRMAWLDRLAASRDGRQIIEDMLDRLDRRAQNERDKKFLKLACQQYIAAKTAELRQLEKRRNYYDQRPSYRNIRESLVAWYELKEYARAEHNIENIMYLEAINDGEKLSDIFDKFIANGAPNYINLSAALSNPIASAMARLKEATAENRGDREENLRQTMLAGARGIEDLINFDLVLRFVTKKQAEYKSPIAEIQQKIAELQVRMKSV